MVYQKNQGCCIVTRYIIHFTIIRDAIVVIILLLTGAFFLITGTMMLVATDALFEINDYVIKKLYKFANYLNTLFYKFSNYLNKTFVNSNGLTSYRIFIGISSILLGLIILYTYYYYSQHASLPPAIRGFVVDILHRFLDEIEGVGVSTPPSAG